MSLFQGTGHRVGGHEHASEQAPDQQELAPAIVVESQSFEEAPEEDGLEVAPEAASVGSSAATSIGHPKDKDEWIGWLMNATDVLQDIGVCSSALVQKLTHRFANSAREELESFNTEVAMTASAIEAAILREDGLNETVFLGLEKDTRLIAERWQELKRAHANLSS